MKRRTILGVLVGLLLPLPFMFDHCGAWLQKHPIQAMMPQGAKLVPILAQDERDALLTYGRSCQDPKDCDPPLACLSLVPGGERVCADSSCRTDLQCKQEFTCRTRQAPGNGPLVRRCVLIGVRKEGQPCIDTAREKEFACGQGLLCGGGSCGRPCQLEVPSSCPEGFVCRAGPETPSCQPFCRGGDCPEGQECLRAGTGEAECMAVIGENCQRRPCPEGQQCKVVGYTPEAEVWSATMECMTPCDGAHPCPEGSMCFQGGCRRTCGPDAQEVCGPGRQCTQYLSKQLWLCEPARD
jgi:hypothetical protein